MVSVGGLPSTSAAPAAEFVREIVWDEEREGRMVLGDAPAGSPTPFAGANTAPFAQAVSFDVRCITTACLVAATGLLYPSLQRLTLVVGRDVHPSALLAFLRRAEDACTSLVSFRLKWVHDGAHGHAMHGTAWQLAQTLRAMPQLTSVHLPRDLAHPLPDPDGLPYVARDSPWHALASLPQLLELTLLERRGPPTHDDSYFPLALVPLPALHMLNLSGPFASFASVLEATAAPSLSTLVLAAPHLAYAAELPAALARLARWLPGLRRLTILVKAHNPAGADADAWLDLAPLRRCGRLAFLRLEYPGLVTPDGAVDAIKRGIPSLEELWINRQRR